MIGYAFCGSFCTLSASLEVLRGLVRDGYDVIPIMSFNVYSTDTRFFAAEDFKKEVKSVCGKDIVHTIKDAEPFGPKIKLDALVISPCTGNTLAKIANGITDTPVCMAAKAQLRSGRPLLLALSTNDALSANLKNLGIMIERKSVFFVPMRQDDPINKPYSLSAEFQMLPEALEKAKRGEQIGKLFIN
jgi:dipicolinate synthase subunit B